MFHHLMTRLTLLTLGWADDDQASPGGRALPRRTAGHRRRTVTGPGSGFSLREPTVTALIAETSPAGCSSP